MTDLANEVAEAAERAVTMSRDRGGRLLDYSESSMDIVDEILGEASEYRADLTQQQVRTLAQDLGCYILEVARRAHGGIYRWADAHGAPVLVTGEPAFHVAMLTWEKVLGRLSGDDADDIPFFYDGYAQRARSAKSGDRVLFV